MRWQRVSPSELLLCVAALIVQIPIRILARNLHQQEKKTIARKKVQIRRKEKSVERVKKYEARPAESV